MWVCVCVNVLVRAYWCEPVRRTVRLCLCPLKVYTFWGLIAGIKVVALAWSGRRVRCDAAADAVDDAMCIYLLKNRGESSESRASKWPKTMPVATRDDANDANDDDDDIKYF